VGIDLGTTNSVVCIQALSSSGMCIEQNYGGALVSYLFPTFVPFTSGFL
jgi:hypothetical protein